MTTLTRTERHRADPAKAGGVVYTPPALARFLASQAFDALGAAKSVRILDPACGDGELLVAALAEAERRSLTVTSIVGYDTDEIAVDQATCRLADATRVNLHVADFIELAAQHSDSQDLFQVDDHFQQPQFDVVISNPPYVRTQTLGSKAAQALGQRFGLAGRVDLYQVFAAAMIQALVPGGAIGLLCSNKFLTNKTGISMRQLLLRELELRELVDLGDTKLFHAAVLPVIVSGSRVKSSTNGARVPRFRAVYEAKPNQLTEQPLSMSVLDALTRQSAGVVEDSGRMFTIREGQLDREGGPELPWNPVDAEARARFGCLRQAKTTEFGAIGKIRVGVKTTADPVFIRSDWADFLERDRPEDELLRPLLTHKDIEQWSARPGSRQILYPHEDLNGRTAAIDLDRFPRAASYLELHRARLERRKYVIESGRKWSEIWVPQKPALWSQPKVVFPDIAESPRFAIDRSGAIVNGDCYWTVIDDEELAEVVVAVGNSSFCTWFYDAACGNFLYAGRRRFMTQYMERLPIPKPTPALVDEIRALRINDRADELDALVWSALGLKQVGR